MKTRILSHRDLYLYDTQGFLHVPGLLTKEEVIYFVELFENHPRNRWFEHAKADRWDDIIHIDSRVEKLCRDTRLVNCALDVINQPMRLIESYAMAYHPGGFLFMHNGSTQDLTYTDGTRATKNMAYRCEYHDGLLYTTYIKTILYLTDIQNEADGPFCYIHGSHKANFPFPWPKKDDGSPILLSESNFPSLAKVKLKAGDMILLNDSLLHGAMRTTAPNKRIMMTFSYAPSFMPDWRRIDPRPNDVHTLGYYDLADESDFF